MAGPSMRYARAFAEVVASARLDASAAKQQLDDFAGTLVESHELRELLGNPSIELAKKLKVLDALAARMGLFPQVRNFVAVILDHGRVGALEEIVAAYRDLADAQAGALEARVTSARALGADARRQLEAQMAKLAGAAVRASYTEDTTLLGGAVVEIGSTVYDGSVRTQLQRLKQTLVNA